MTSLGRVEVDAELAERLGEFGGGGIVVFDTDRVRAERGLKHALSQLARLPHPDEPDSALVKFISEIGVSPDGGVGSSFDSPDLGALEQHHLVIETLKRALEESGVTGRLTGIDPAVLQPIGVEARPQPWSGDVLPDWMPVPQEAVDRRGVFATGNGFVEFWVPASLDLIAFYLAALPAAGFDVGEPSSKRRAELPDGQSVVFHSLDFVGLGRRCRLESGFRDRFSARDTGVLEVKVNIRCDLLRAGSR